jgi:hypothetical protein
VKDLKHLSDVLLEKVFYFTNQEPSNTPLPEDQSPPGLNMVRQVLDCVAAELAVAKRMSLTKHSDPIIALPSVSFPFKKYLTRV